MLDQNAENGPNPLPIWMSIPIILISLVAGGWMIKWYVMSDPISHDIKILGDPAKGVAQAGRATAWPNFNGPGNTGGGGNGAGGAGGNRNRRNTTPHMLLLDAQNERWETKTDMATAISFKDRQGVIQLRLLYNSNTFPPRDVSTTLASAAAIARDTHRAEALKLNVGQVKNLQRFSAGSSDMVVAAADKDLFRTEITKYTHATDAERPALEASLYKTLDDVAHRSLAASIQVASEHAKEINQIITPQLWQQNAQLGAPAR